MERTCLDCGNPIKGRIDKKFCDDQCRSNYNNKLKPETPPAIKKINAILKNNRDILEKLNPEAKTKISKARLLKTGFDLQYHTHQLQTQKGNTYNFCYEYGYLALDDETFLLVKREENL